MLHTSTQCVAKRLRFCFIFLATACGISSIANVAAAKTRCTSISTAAELDSIRDHPGGNYCLANDIDASVLSNFRPIEEFGGIINGRGHSIRNLRIDGPGFIILLTKNAVVERLHLIGVNVTASSQTQYVGALAAQTDIDAIVDRVSVTGSVSGGQNTAGLIGFNNLSTISLSSAKITVNGDKNAAGLIALSKGSVVGCSAAGFVSGIISGGLVAVTQSRLGVDTQIKQSYSTAKVTGSQMAAGLVALGGGIVASYSTGDVEVTGNNGIAGGLLGTISGRSGGIAQSFATGTVSAQNGGYAGGLVGGGWDIYISDSYSTGPVFLMGESGFVGGLAGRSGKTHNGTVLNSIFSVGPVSASHGQAGGLIGLNKRPVKAGYWDIQTSGLTVSAGGAGRRTSKLQAGLPSGFSSQAWAITPGYTYPYLTSTELNFASTLAMLVKGTKLYTFLPIDQFDDWQYSEAIADTNRTSESTAFTMIARAIGRTDGIASLTDVPVDTYFWDETHRRNVWRGPVTDYATLGNVVPIADAEPIDDDNVIGVLKSRNLAIIRGTFTKSNGGLQTHWMLGTSFTVDTEGNLTSLVANDPSTGLQLRIDPETKTVISPPPQFSLPDFRVTGYRVVTID